MTVMDVVKTTCPRDCYDACGILIYREDGAITKVLGDPDHPVAKGKLCGKCAIAYNGVWRDPAVRLSAPLKRVGPKGDGAFVIAGTWLLADLSAAMGDDVGFVLPPTGESGELAVTGGTGLPFAITESTEHADAAAAYLDHITSPEAMTDIEQAGNLPVYGAGSAPAEGAQADVLDAWGAANEQGAIVRYLDYATPAFYDLLTAQVTDLLAGKQPPDAFLSALEEEYTAFTSSGG